MTFTKSPGLYRSTDVKRSASVSILVSSTRMMMSPISMIPLLSVTVQQGPAAVAGIDCRVLLYDVGDGTANGAP